MGRDDLRFEEELETGSEILDALETAELAIVPLSLEPDISEHIAEEFKLPGLVVTDKAVSIRKAIDDALAIRKKQYMALKISGILDKAGATQVHAARMEMKDIRIHFEKSRKRQNEAARTHIKNVDTEAKRFQAMVEPVETYLEAQENAYEALVSAEKAAKQKVVDDRNQGRVDALSAVGCPVVLSEIVLMSEQTFGEYLAMATKGFEEAKRQEAEAKAIETARLAAEAYAAEVEAKRLAEEKAQIAADRLELAALRAKADAVEATRVAEANRLNAEIQAERAALETERAKLAKAEADRVAAVKAAEERAIAHDAQAAAAEKAWAEAEANAAVRAKVLEALRPDAEKLLAYSELLMDIPSPELSTHDGTVALNKSMNLIRDCSESIRKLALSLTI